MVRAFWRGCGVASRRHLCRTPTATDSSPAAWARTTARGPGRNRHPDLGRQHRPADHDHEGFRRDCHLLHADLLSCIITERAGELGVDMKKLAAAGGILRRRALDRIHAQAHRRPAAASRPSIFMASRRSSARAWAANANAITACTSSKTTSIRRSSIRRPAAPLPDGSEGELVLTTLEQAGHAHDSLPHARHHRHSSRAFASADARCGASSASAGAATTC